MTLTVLGQTLTGDFSFAHTSTTDTLTASNVSFALGNGATNFVTLSHGEGNFTITGAGGSATTGNGLEGSLSGQIAVTVPGVDLTAGLSVAIDTTLGAASYVQVSGTGVTLSVLGQSVTGNVTFSRDASRTVHLGFDHLAITLGSASAGLTITQGIGDLTVAASGVTGHVSALVAFNGLPSEVSFGQNIAIDVAFAPGSLLAQLGTNQSPFTATLFGQTLTGAFSFQAVTDAGPDGRLNTSDDRRVVKIAATSVGLFLGTGSTGVTLTGGSALLLITPDGTAGQLSGGVTVNLGSAATVAVNTVTITFNTLASAGTPEAVNEVFTVGGATQTLSLPAGHFLTVAAQGARITVGGQTLSGDLTVTRTGTTGSYTTVVTLANGGLRIGTSQRAFVVVSGAAGTLTVASAGIYGSLTADVAVTIPGVTVGGTFSVAINTTGATQGQLAPGYVVSGHNITLQIAGQTLTGDVTVGRDTVRDISYLTVSNLSLALGNGSTTFLTATITSGTVELTNTGVAGELTATLAPSAALAAYLTFSGPVTVAFNTTPGSLNPVTDVGGTGGSTLPAGPYLRIEAGTRAAPVNLTIFGQSLTAHFWFEQTTTQNGLKVVSIGFDNTSLVIGTSGFTAVNPPANSTGIAVTGASGALELLPGGVAGRLSGSPHVQIPGFSVSATSLNIDFNTTTSAVNDTLHYTGTNGPATQALTLAAGPYVRVEADQLTVSLAGNSVRGDFFFQYATSAPSAGGTATPTMEIGVANIAFNGSSSVGPISGARGALVVLPKSGGGFGLAGIALGTASGSVGSADLGLEINTTGTNVDQVVTVGGVAIPIKIDAGTTFAVVAQDVNLNLGGLLEIKGNFALTNNSFSGTGLSLFVGSGPYSNPDGTINANAIGLLINQASLSFRLAPGAGKADGLYVLSATGTLALVGLDGLTLSADSGHLPDQHHRQPTQPDRFHHGPDPGLHVPAHRQQRPLHRGLGARHPRLAGRQSHGERNPDPGHRQRRHEHQRVRDDRCSASAVAPASRSTPATGFHMTSFSVGSFALFRVLEQHDTELGPGGGVVPHRLDRLPAGRGDLV